MIGRHTRRPRSHDRVAQRRLVFLPRAERSLLPLAGVARSIDDAQRRASRVAPGPAGHTGRCCRAMTPRGRDRLEHRGSLGGGVCWARTGRSPRVVRHRRRAGTDRRRSTRCARPLLPRRRWLVVDAAAREPVHRECDHHDRADREQCTSLHGPQLGTPARVGKPAPSYRWKAGGAHGYSARLFFMMLPRCAAQ
jgi:hypothetical protein